MNKRLLSLFVSLLALSGTLTAVMAIGGESEQTLPVAPISGGDLKARVFDLRTEWDIGIDQYWGGDPSDLPNPSELRANEYMFTGEQKRIYFLVRDLNGAEDISSAKLGWMEGEERFTPVLCNIKPANTIVDN